MRVPLRGSNPTASAVTANTPPKKDTRNRLRSEARHNHNTSAAPTKARDGVHQVAEASSAPLPSSPHVEGNRIAIQMPAKASVALSQRCCAVRNEGSAIWKPVKMTTAASAARRDASRAGSQNSSAHCSEKSRITGIRPTHKEAPCVFQNPP